MQHTYFSGNSHGTKPRSPQLRLGVFWCSAVFDLLKHEFRNLAKRPVLLGAMGWFYSNANYAPPNGKDPRAAGCGDAVGVRVTFGV